MIALLFFGSIGLNLASAVAYIVQTNRTRRRLAALLEAVQQPLPPIAAEFIFAAAQGAESVEQFMANLRSRVGPWGLRA